MSSFRRPQQAPLNQLEDVDRTVKVPRKLVTSIVIIGLFVLYESFIPLGYKISTLLGHFEGNTESEALSTQVEGLKVKLAAEITAKVQQQNEIDAYKQKLDIELQNTINAYKLQLDAQLEEFKNRISLTSQKAVDTNRLNLERRNQMTQTLLMPIMEGMKTSAQFAAMGMKRDIPDYDGLIHSVTEKVRLEVGAVEADEAGRSAAAMMLFCGTKPVFSPFNQQTPYSPAPASAPSPPPPSPPKTNFQHGANDRTNWENWFSSLQGEYRSGAFYWAAKRNIKSPLPSCEDEQNDSYGDFTDGCRKARELLTQADQKRGSDAEYKSGWNSINLPTKAPPRVCAVIGIKPDDPDGGLRIRSASLATAKSDPIRPPNPI